MVTMLCYCVPRMLIQPPLVVAIIAVVIREWNAYNSCDFDTTNELTMREYLLIKVCPSLKIIYRLVACFISWLVICLRWTCVCD